MRNFILLVGVLVLGGCDGDDDRLVTPTPVSQASFVLPDQGWAGGPLAIRSSAFAADTTVPEIRIGGVAVPVSRSNDSVVVAVVPDTMAGPREVTLLQGGETRVLGTVAVSGITAVVNRTEVRSTRRLGVPYPQDGVASLLTVVDGRLTLLDYDAGTTTTLPVEDGNAQVGPGPTFDPDVWLTRKESDAPIEVWRLRPVPVKLDEHVLPPGADSRLILGMPAPDTIVMVPTRSVNRYVRQPDGSWVGMNTLPLVFAEDAIRLVISPRRNRWVLGPSNTFWSTFEGPDEPFHLAVWEGVTERAFALPDVSTSLHYAFSPTGDELALIGDVRPFEVGVPRPVWLIVVDPEDGTERHRRRLFGERRMALAYDRTRPLLYLLTDEEGPTGTVKTLEVIDRNDWQVVGKVRLPVVALTQEWVILPSNQGRVHVIQGTVSYTIGPVL